MNINNLFYTLQGIFAGYVTLVACESKYIYTTLGYLLLIVSGTMLVSSVSYFINQMMREE